MSKSLTENSGWLDASTGQFTSFAGADAVVLFEGAHIANLQSITINTTREIVPLYVLGSAEPKSFNRNKRAIAGSMVMLNFDRSMLIWTLKHMSPNTNYRKRVNQGMLTAAGNVTRGYTQRNQEAYNYIGALLTGQNNIAGQGNDLVDAFFALNSNIQEFQFLTQNNYMQTGTPFAPRPYVYEDQLPAFDICVMFNNSDGASAHMNLRGCMVMNTAFGISIDDALSEKAMTFVAQRMEDLRPGIADEGEPLATDPGIVSVGGQAVTTEQLWGGLPGYMPFTATLRDVSVIQNSPGVNYIDNAAYSNVLSAAQDLTNGMYTEI